MDAERIQVRRIGYLPATLRIERGSTTLRIVMRALPAPLPDVVVAAARELCPNAPDPAASALWQRARERYAQGMAGRGTLRQALRWEGSVSPESVGVVVDPRRRPSWTAKTGVPQRALARRLPAEGYATPLRYTKPGYQPLEEQYLAWRYARLESTEAYHFADSAFGARHTLSVVASDADGTRIAFCGKRGRLPGMEGTLSIAADTTLLSASWQFITPRPDEEAGGEVAFLPPGPRDGSRAGYLLPSRGVFWRRIAGRQRFHQRAETYLQWVVGADSTMPKPTSGVQHPQ